MTNQDSYNKTIQNRQSKNKEALIATLKEMPIIEVAVKRAGISRDTYYRWKHDDKEFSKQSESAMAEGFDFINDLSEAQIINLIKDKKIQAMALWLKHHHPRYGPKFKSYSPIATKEDLTPEERKIITEALNLASGVIVQEQTHGKNNLNASG